MNNSGKLFEDIICKYLVDNKHKILERNFISKFGEIDIISSKDNIIHYVEVKARKSNSKYYPAESVTKTKMNKIKTTAKFFLLKNQVFGNYFMQFDVVEYIIDKKNINVIENCFY